MNGGATQRNIKKRVKRQPLLPILNINYPRGGKTHVPYPTANIRVLKERKKYSRGNAASPKRMLLISDNISYRH